MHRLTLRQQQAIAILRSVDQRRGTKPGTWHRAQDIGLGLSGVLAQLARRELIDMMRENCGLTWIYFYRLKGGAS